MTECDGNSLPVRLHVARDSDHPVRSRAGSPASLWSGRDSDGERRGNWSGIRSDYRDSRHRRYWPSWHRGSRQLPMKRIVRRGRRTSRCLPSVNLKEVVRGHRLHGTTLRPIASSSSKAVPVTRVVMLGASVMRRFVSPPPSGSVVEHDGAINRPVTADSETRPFRERRVTVRRHVLR